MQGWNVFRHLRFCTSMFDLCHWMISWKWFNISAQFGSNKNLLNWLTPLHPIFLGSLQFERFLGIVNLGREKYHLKKNWRENLKKKKPITRVKCFQGNALLNKAIIMWMAQMNNFLSIFLLFPKDIAFSLIMCICDDYGLMGKLSTFSAVYFFSFATDLWPVFLPT